MSPTPSPVPAAPPVAPYVPRRRAVSRHLPVRGLDYHVSLWGSPADVVPGRPPLVLVHGWMDVGASFQFVVDALAEVDGFDRYVIAPDWRGFGRTEAPRVDSYWFPDYLGDLDVLLDALVPDQAVDLAGHSMGGNVVMIYAGVRPARVRRLINLEGFGMPETRPAQAPTRYAQWLDALKAPQSLKPYPDLTRVAARLTQNNPLLTPDKAAWLAPHWARQGGDGQWRLRADPAHKRVNPILYRKDEVLEVWQRIEAPVLWVDGDLTDTTKWWGHRYPREDFEARLAVVPKLERHRLSPCGHMLHHDQPEALARRLAEFLG